MPWIKTTANSAPDHLLERFRGVNRGNRPGFRSSPLRVAVASLLIPSVLVALNLHLALFQLLGWGSMLHENWVETGSLRSSVTVTFSGEAPCEFCDTVREQLTRQQDEPAMPWSTGMERAILLLIPHWTQPSVHKPAGVEGQRVSMREHGWMRADRPPVPPPKA